MTTHVPATLIENTTIQAQRWVEAWLKMMAEHPDAATNPDVVRTWFNAAICSGIDHARMKAREKL